MDQGRDAVYVRDILNGHLTLTGPSASIDGIYTGPLWYYFLAIVFFLFGGHPIAGPLMLIIINLAVILLLALFLKKKIGNCYSLLIAAILCFSSSFFETSLYAFNPFLLSALTLATVLLFSANSKNKTKHFLVAGLLVGLSIHSQIAFYFPFLFFFFVVVAVLVYKKKLSLRKAVFGFFVSTLMLVPHIITELQSNFLQFNAAISSFGSTEAGVAVASGEKLSHFTNTFLEFVKLAGKATFPFSYYVGIGIILVLAIVFFSQQRKKSIKESYFFTRRFIYLSTLLWIISFLWFSLSTGLSDWHLVGLPALLIVSLALIILLLPKKLARVFLGLFLIIQISGTLSRIVQLKNDGDNQSYLKNELAAIDWIYVSSENQGFEAYSYLPSVKDYPYQYLFWWRGIKKYDYLPCRYAVDSLGASSYIPHAKDYREPKKTCSGIVYLIIEPAVHEKLFKDWHNYISKNTTLLDSKEFGKIIVEKRKRKTSNR